MMFTKELLMANANVNAPDGTGMRLVCTGILYCVSQLELHLEVSSDMLYHHVADIP